MAAEGLHISVAPEPVAHIGSFEITNSLLTSFIVMLILIALALRAKAIDPKVKSDPSSYSKISIMIDLIIEKFYDFFKGILGEKQVKRLFPLLFTFFIFILFYIY